MKKFNGHRCERRNLTDLVLGTGPDGKKRAQPKAKKRAKNYTTEPAANKMPDGGPTNPFINPQLLAQMQALQGLTPDYGAQVLPSNDRLTSYSENQLRAYETAMHRQNLADTMQNVKQAAINTAEYAAENPLDATQVALGGLAIGADAIPVAGTVVSAVADGANAAISGGRAAYYNAMGDTSNAAFYSGLAALDAAAAIPGGGNIAGVTKIGALLDKGLHYAHPASKMVTGYKGANLGYEANVTDAPILSHGPTMTYGGETYRKMNPGGYTFSPDSPFYQPDLQNLAPGLVPDALAQYQTGAANFNMFSSGIGALGSFVQANAPEELNADYSFNDAFGGIASGVSKGMKFGPWGAVIGGAVGLGKSIWDHKKDQEEYRNMRKEKMEAIEEMNVDQVDNFNKMAYADFNQFGGASRFNYGGRTKPDYETEKSEVIIAGAGDKPIAMGQGNYTRLSQNVYKANGPSHAYGGIPTAGATKPFVDSSGQAHQSPYVYSDSKDMAFDATDILKMIS